MPSAAPRVSVVTFTNAAPAAVAANLQALAGVAHEIVVAVDERVDPLVLGPLTEVADRLVRAEFVPPLEANLAWLHSLATGDWVLRLDGDDVVSDELIALLRRPGWDHGITHGYLQYRWLWSPERMLDQPPWHPDPALRLIRTTPGIATFPTTAHHPPVVAGAGRLFDVPLYHLDLVVADEAARAAKAERYERDAPGHRTDRGWAVSATYYLPERAGDALRTAPVPPGDAARVARVLRGVREPAEPATTPPLLDPVVWAHDRVPPPPAPGDAAIRAVGPTQVAIIEGRGAVVTVGVANRGPVTWSPSDEPASQVGGRFVDARGEQVGAELRAPLPCPLRPGDEILVRVPLPPHLPPGAVRLEVGLVRDGVAWHDAVLDLALARRRGRRVVVSTGVSDYPHLGDDLITRELLAALALHLPDVVPTLIAHPHDGLAERFGCDVAPGPAAAGTSAERLGGSGRRVRDLVGQARVLAKGGTPDDPAIGELLAPFAEADAYIAAPGGGLASRYSAEALMVFASEVLIAQAFGLPVFIEGPSIGPIEMRRDQAALGQMLNGAARITVRDERSADAARRIGRAVDVAVVPDLATTAVRSARSGTGAELARAWLDARNIPADRPYAVVTLRGGTSDQRHVDTLRAALGALPEHTALVFLPHCRHPGAPDDDLALVQADPWLASHLAAVDHPLGMDAEVALTAGATWAIGTRFHQAVLASAAGVRTVALAADGYDRQRLRAVRAWPGLRMVALDDPAAASAAVADLQLGEVPEPLPAWDPAAFAAALGPHLPAAPALA